MSGADRRPVMYGDAHKWVLVRADALALMPEMPANGVDAVITDPPYGLGFAGEAWDGGRLTNPAHFQEWTSAWAAQTLRVLKPGGWLAAFGSPRTFHRLVAGVEEAGFEVRDQLLWLYGQGVPKSRSRHDGLGTSLKPAYEPILLARKPLAAATLEENLARHGTGALQIDAARVSRSDHDKGYWPANIALAHSQRCRTSGCEPDCPAALIDRRYPHGKGLSRLFYAPKANRKEREAGCERLPLKDVPIYPRGGGAVRQVRNIHPTVKPIALMRWLARLLCAPDGTVLDPFTGSGSTGAGCVLEGRRFAGIERDSEYVDVARARIAYWAAQPGADG